MVGEVKLGADHIFWFSNVKIVMVICKIVIADITVEFNIKHGSLDYNLQQLFLHMSTVAKTQDIFLLMKGSHFYLVLFVHQSEIL